MDTVNTAGAVSGTIETIFGNPANGYYESGYQGTLEKVTLDATLNRLRFDFWNGGSTEGYGPLQFDLQRVTTP